MIEKFYHFKDDEIYLIPLGDLHIGEKASFFEKALKILDNAKENEYFVMVGDLIDNALSDSIGDTHNQALNIEEQINIVRRILERGKDKILGVISGNHEYRAAKLAGIEPLKVICDSLGILYDENLLVLEIAVGNNASYGSARRMQYNIVVAHGYTSARTIGGKINANARIMDIINNADIYITGHTHQPSVVFNANYEIDKRNKNVKLYQNALITTTAFVGYAKYAERKFYPPNAFVNVKIKLVGKGQDKKAEIIHEIYF
ncbi:MAG: metallophosphoesterase [Candidatus Asgardarchaeia archaeon]